MLILIGFANIIQIIVWTDSGLHKLIPNYSNTMIY